eukprot:Skav222768  [mRNA]  locus=scaffold600:295912:317957:+ [translate_table: standard]
MSRVTTWQPVRLTEKGGTAAAGLEPWSSLAGNSDFLAEIGGSSWKCYADADACLTVPLLLGVADGVEQLGMHQLIPGVKLSAADTYRGPVSMLRRAFEATESLGSLTVVLAVRGGRAPLELVCHTEMQRIDGHAQTPLQLARVDDRTVLFRDLANRSLLPSATSGPQYSETQLRGLAQRIVEQCHAKTRPMVNGLLPEAPIGRGGKKDDTSCVVAEVVEWTDEMQKIWEPEPKASWMPFDGSFLSFNSCCVASVDSDDEPSDPVKPSFHPNESNGGKDFGDFGPCFASSAQPGQSQGHGPRLSPGQQMFGMPLPQVQGHPPVQMPGALIHGVHQVPQVPQVPQMPMASLYPMPMQGNPYMKLPGTQMFPGQPASTAFGAFPSGQSGTLQLEATSEPATPRSPSRSPTSNSIPSAGGARVATRSETSGNLEPMEADFDSGCHWRAPLCYAFAFLLWSLLLFAFLRSDNPRVQPELQKVVLWYGVILLLVPLALFAFKAIMGTRVANGLKALSDFAACLCKHSASQMLTYGRRKSFRQKPLGKSRALKAPFDIMLKQAFCQFWLYAVSAQVDITEGLICIDGLQLKNPPEREWRSPYLLTAKRALSFGQLPWFWMELLPRGIRCHVLLRDFVCSRCRQLTVQELHVVGVDLIYEKTFNSSNVNDVLTKISEIKENLRPPESPGLALRFREFLGMMANIAAADLTYEAIRVSEGCDDAAPAPLPLPATNARAWSELMLAKAHMGMREYSRAASVLKDHQWEKRKEEEIAEVQDPVAQLGVAPCLYVYGITLKGLELKEDARRILLESVQAFPCNWSAWLDIISNESAKNLYVMLRGTFPESSYLTSQLATCFYNMRSGEQSGVERGAGIDKYTPEACSIIGNYYSLKGEHEKAVVYFQLLGRQPAPPPGGFSGSKFLRWSLRVPRVALRRALSLNRHFTPAPWAPKIGPAAWILMGHEFMEMKNTPAVAGRRFWAPLHMGGGHASSVDGASVEGNQKFNFFTAAASTIPNFGRFGVPLPFSLHDVSCFVNWHSLYAFIYAGPNRSMPIRSRTEAIDAYRTAVTINQRDYRAWYGLHYYALFYYRRAMLLRPEDARMWCAMAQCYDLMSRKALRCYEKAHRCGDRERMALPRLARLHRDLGQRRRFNGRGTGRRSSFFEGKTQV